MNKFIVTSLLVLSMVICCTSQALDYKLKTLTLSQTINRDNNLVLNCDLGLESNEELVGVNMQYKDQWYYGVDIGNMTERYDPNVIASDRLIDRTPPLYDRTSKYGHIRNVITGATESDDYDCFVTFRVSGLTFTQSSREVIVNRLRFTPQKGVENIKMNLDSNKQLYLTINPVDKANVNTEGQYECKVNYINPDGDDDHIEILRPLNRIKERYNNTVIDSTRVIDRVPPLYNSTVKYGHIRNVLSDTLPSDDFDCYITWYDGIGTYCTQSSRKVPDQRSIKTSILVNNVLSNQYSAGDDVKIHCDYQLQPKDTFVDLQAIKDDHRFYRYINKERVFFTPQTGIENIKVDANTNQRLWLTINPINRANDYTGGQYKCQVNYVKPDGGDAKIEHFVQLSL
ncbi:unnamed protein product, partial [Medioppia subpectinata]